MEHVKQLPLHNLGLYRLKGFVGRSEELKELGDWFNKHPVVAITGPSGAGKSTLATALAVQEAYKFEQGILWISATGNEPFNFYDIVCTIEDVLATGITNQLVTAWPLIVLQQLYGANRLLILDELTEADADTVNQIIAMIGQIKPGGYGRFVLIGRTLPDPLLDIAGEAHWVLGGLAQEDIQEWINNHQDTYPISPESASMIHQFTGGHPLAFKLVAGLWESRDWGELFDLVSIQDPDDWEARLQATVIAALANLSRRYPQANQLLTECSQASGGFEAEAIKNLYWPNIQSDMSLIVTLQKLLKRGLLLYNPQAKRYFIHPLIRRYLNIANYAGLTATEQSQGAYRHAAFYLQMIKGHNLLTPQNWPALDDEWGNIRKAFDFLVSELEKRLDIEIEIDEIEQILSQFDALETFAISTSFEETLTLIRGYALALRTYIVSRHPPEGYQWLTAGIIAAHILTLDAPQAERHSQAEALLTKDLAALAYARQDYAAAEIWYRYNLPFFKQVDDQDQLLETLIELGMTLKEMDRLDEALAIYHEALQIAEDHNFIAEQAKLQAKIGDIDYSRETYEAAIKRYQKALSLAEAQDDEVEQAGHHNEIGLALEASDKFEEAIEHYRQAADLYGKQSDKISLSITYHNLGAAYYHWGYPEEALNWYERDLAMMDGLGNWFDLATTLHNMGHVALDMGNFQTAISYFIRSRDIYLQFGQIELANEDQILIDTIQDRHTTVG